MGVMTNTLKKFHTGEVRMEDCTLSSGMIATIKGYFDDGFVFITEDFRVLTDIEDVKRTGCKTFFMYNPTEPKPGYVWFCIKYTLEDAEKKSWKRDAGKAPKKVSDLDNKHKKYKTFVKEIFLNYDKIVAGTYMKVEKEKKEKKKREIEWVSLQEVFIENGITEEGWNDIINDKECWNRIEGKVIHRVSKSLIDKYKKYSIYNGIFADCNSYLYCGINVWAEDEYGGKIYDLDEYCKFSGKCYVVQDSENTGGYDESLFEQDWVGLDCIKFDKDRTDIDFRKNEDGSYWFEIKEHNCYNGDGIVNSIAGELYDSYHS